MIYKGEFNQNITLRMSANDSDLTYFKFVVMFLLFIKVNVDMMKVHNHQTFSPAIVFNIVRDINILWAFEALSEYFLLSVHTVQYLSL